MSKRRSLFPRVLTILGAGALGLALLATPSSVDAFCGFYVAGADAELYNDATVVVMMRDGTRTVLSMQNDYQGPPEDFAMVVPVPVVLSEDDVKTLPREVFDRVDKLAAPRLVEYWEQDPCQPPVEYKRRRSGGVPRPSAAPAGGAPDKDYGVTIEAEFTVGEYDIVILSASDSTGLDSWLDDNGYKIPDGAEPLLRPYVESGMKFFVAKVDVTKVKFEARPDGSKRATLSPLRFHYDSPEFALPVRLGLINAPAGGQAEDPRQGAQDLLVHILAREDRYQVANYPNVTIPTNLEVKDQAKDHFGQFYVSLFDHTLLEHPKAVVTEYAWSASSCDPCPEPALTVSELATLGADVLPSYAGKFEDGQAKDPDLQWSLPRDFVLTRLHARYDASSLGEDLVFEKAPAIAGGREFLQESGQLERGAVPQPGGQNQFQARYIIRHPWTGDIDCENPQRGIWGGKPGSGSDKPQPRVARKLASVERDASLGSFVTAESGKILGVASTALDAPAGEDGGEPADGGAEAKTDDGDANTEGEAKADAPAAKTDEAEREGKASGKGCRCEVDAGSPGGAGGLGLGLLALISLATRRKTRSQP